MVEILALLVAAFVLGAIPFSYLLVKAMKGIDVRTVGSGNPGATNAARAFGKRAQVPAFLMIFSFDAGKGYLASTVLPTLIGVETGGSLPALAAVAAVLGHSFTPFLRFKGGKGVATTIGALLGLDFVSTLFAMGAFFVSFGLTRIVSVGSLVFALALPIAVLWRGEASSAVVYVAAGLSLLIVLRHRSNIRRLIRGVET